MSSSLAHSHTHTLLCAATARTLAARKPSSKLGGGLVKKLDSKVDESVFEQPPAAEPVRPAVPEPASVTAEAPSSAASTASRFSYDVLTQVRTRNVMLVAWQGMHLWRG